MNHNYLIFILDFKRVDNLHFMEAFTNLIF